MKKIIALLLTLLMFLSLTACDSQPPIEDNNLNGQPEIETPVGGETETPEENADKEPEEEPIDEEKEEPAEEDKEETPSFSPESLTVWGLSEPPFPYEMEGYYVTPYGMSENGVDPNLVPRFVYSASADYPTTQAYAASTSNLGWGGYIPDPNEVSPFGYMGQLGDYKVIIRWESDGNVTVIVTDLSKFGFWDDNEDVYVVPEYGVYGTYGEYDAGLEGR